MSKAILWKIPLRMTRKWMQKACTSVHSEVCIQIQYLSIWAHVSQWTTEQCENHLSFKWLHPGLFECDWTFSYIYIFRKHHTVLFIWERHASLPVRKPEERRRPLLSHLLVLLRWGTPMENERATLQPTPATFITPIHLTLREAHLARFHLEIVHIKKMSLGILNGREDSSLAEVS